MNASLRAGLARGHQILSRTGINLPALTQSLAGIPYFFRTLAEYRKLSRGQRFPLKARNLYPCLSDRHAQAGIGDRHYFYQDLWAARKIEQRRPPRHVDVGSRIDGFIAHLLTFMPVEVVDVRPMRSAVEGLHFVQSDATEMSGFEAGSLVSLSCLHAAEHFGLGRYGDPVSPGAPFRLMASLQRVLAPGGHLYFSVPVGVERLEFNAHRIFAPQTVLDGFPGLTLESFSYVDDQGAFHQAAQIHEADGSRLACGLFEFTKPVIS